MELQPSFAVYAGGCISLFTSAMLRRQHRSLAGTGGFGMDHVDWKTACSLACALLLVACASSIRTEHDLDPDADFAQYRSFAWISEKPLIGPRPGVTSGEYISPIDDQRIRGAVDADLLAKGYRTAESLDAADLVVSYSVGSQQKVKTESVPGRSSTYHSGYGGGSWYGGSSVRTYSYTEGTLALEFYDRETRQAVWVGWASKRLSKSDDSEEILKKAVTAILEEFPAPSAR
jgi:hypothetical protein